MCVSNVVRVDPRELQPFPDQERVYGKLGGEHDRGLDDLHQRIGQTGIITPVVVVGNAPGLPRGTIVSGHRRAAVAARLGWKVPVEYHDFETDADAKAAWLALNEQREKDEWVRTQEAVAWREVEAERAKARMLAGTAPCGTGSTGSPDTGKTRDKVAEHLHESGKTTELRFKLDAKAREQNPEDPGASPIAQSLREGKAVKTVAREFEVIPAPKPKAPEPVKPETVEGAVAFAEDPQQLRIPGSGEVATSSEVDDGDDFEIDTTSEPVETVVADGTGEPEHVDRSDPARRPDLGELDDSMAFSKVDTLCRSFESALGAALADRPLATLRSTYRRGAENALLRVLRLVSDQMKAANAKPAFGVIQGGK